ncbi:M48 family metallopeptidase [Chryseobacterium sp. BIGb0232]|uniref:tetratricopeptide repeat protein n=1 Tax=Chryseobacterium sp. BIGb0232 TaxID=2940598 RepID=UPI000F45F67F|nr:hypothetical protein [Chryseobacterium sp. BIGb0232]MCS4301180.1 tetratricopeptide (TPR) repeat protein [Chryseobacterium sp. BIGb0232]ROS19959.1 hypothetical protein EDF65_0659 [Chryseobacterium nakagawai]
MIKKTIFTTILFFGLTMTYSQSTYDGIMTERIIELDSAQSHNTLRRIANDFERIALADETNWLAHYYTAYAYLQMAYTAQSEQVDGYCNQAENHLKNAEKIHPKNSEIYALYAYLYGAKVNVDPMARGAEMGKKSASYINLSIKANPENPRPYLLRAMGIYYTPKAFGGGPEKAIPYLEKALEKYKVFTPAFTNAPQWGKSLTEQLLSTSIKSK